MFKTEVSGTTYENYKSNIIALARAMMDDDAKVAAQPDLPFVIAQAAPAVTPTKRTRKNKGEDVSPAPAPEASAASASPSSPAAEASDAPLTNGLTMDDIKADLGKLIATGDAGVEIGFKILESFGATKVSQIKPADFAAFREKVTQATPA